MASSAQAFGLMVVEAVSISHVRLPLVKPVEASKISSLIMVTVYSVF